MDLQQFMIGTTFVFGIAVVLAGIVAIWKSKRSSSADFKIAGISASGSGGALILVVGAVFVLSSFGWAASHQEAQTQTAIANQSKEEVRRASDAIDKYEAEKQDLRAHLAQSLTPEKLREIDSKFPALAAGRKWTAPPALVKPTLGAAGHMVVAPQH